ncbi:hypothetical protein ISN44_As12g039890 [Arabidopsis suecica]|uniref:Uncharacterized protein n=1 Tax=Arabidopsis suecica TaxID=45249 RepID=A0A8T1YS64_ARASU|nr:hypothetical protein ISN44_As12g039890 [Arabidopsis suecica]
MEEAKTEVEKKVSILLKFIQNKNKIPKVTKKELVGIVEDLHKQCQLLYSVFDDLGTNGRKGKLGTDTSSRSSSDLDYYSSEEIEISADNVSETLRSDYAVILRKLKESELRNEDLERQVSNLKQETDYLRDQNMEVAGDIEGKRNEDRGHLKGLMSKSEAALLCNQKKELELELEKKTFQVSETQMRLKRLEEETEKHDKAKMKIVEEKEALWNKVQKLEAGVDTLRKKRKEFNEEMKSKITEIDCLREENQKLHTRIVVIDEIEEKSKKLDYQVKEQEDIIQRLSMEIKDQKKLMKEQKDAIDKFSEDQKVMKRWSFGSKLNTNLLEKKMEELAEDFRMKMEDNIRILHRRIHVAEQIHLESKNNYIKKRDNTQKQENRGNRADFKKIKEIVEQGLAGPEMAIKKLEESGELVSRVTRLSKEIDSARKWVKEKDNNMKHEVETLEAKLECREAQESLLKEKLSKLEAKLGEEGTEKLSLSKAMRKIKKLEIDVKEKEYELLSLGEGKREAIRQLCVLVDYQRCRYNDLKTSICHVALQA